MHRTLGRVHSEWVMAPEDYEMWVNTRGEIYRPDARAKIEAMLDKIEERYREDT